MTIDELRARRIVHLVHDLCRTSFDHLRVLDLGCLEGLYSVELARRGARVVGIEGREANIAKARFAQEALGLEGVEFVRDDVRNLSPEKYGSFDVVLCLGLLYHLDAPDVFEFADACARCCDQLLVVDTHVGLAPTVRHTFRGRTYSGRSYQEHEPGSTPAERERSSWASLENPRNFWLTRPSLYNLLVDVGFGAVLECRAPYLPNLADRVTLAALKPFGREGGDPELLSHRWPEAPPRAVEPSQRWYVRARRFLRPRRRLAALRGRV